MLEEYIITKTYDPFAVLLFARYWRIIHNPDASIRYNTINDGLLIAIIEAAVADWQLFATFDTPGTATFSNYYFQIV